MRDFSDFHQRNLMKFEHNTSIGVAMNPFGTKFRKFSYKVSFIDKNLKK